ncbi:D-amino-acid transaminase [Natronospirillum operosum]|uniref:Aminodeoxychorismate lyase n=1 Tax=Natronospirillum operosum TaxID=2759953 RepID=A0A4Z0W9Z1_9GAMM|nr:D-amino-acid transaminase [Natronospirillum operosum]TGG94009.1 D-amino-acid transaminase [Natronospirillum operosum]
MSRTVYVNGDWVPEEAATISVFDRGFLMADGVYEVVTVLEGKLVDFAGHCRRLHRSLSELDIASPHTEEEWLQLQRDLVHRNRLREGLVYLQVTRGAEDRDFAWSEGLTPGVVMFTQARSLVDNPLVERGLDIITIDDLRWQRRDIKTVQLLYSSMGKMMAKRAGAHDAWMVEDGLVTEGTSNNAYIIAGRRLITRQAGHAILQGITRTAVLALAAETGLELEERPFTVAEAQAADEAFVTSATTFVMPVVTVDGVKIGDGQPGPMARKLREHYLQQARDAAI